MERSSGDLQPLPPMTTGDCEEFNTWSKIVGWDTDYKQLGPGKFSAKYWPCVSPNLRIGSRYTNREIIVSATPPAGCVPLIIPLNRGDKGSFQGRSFGDCNIALMCPGSEAIYRSPPHLNILTVSIPLGRLRQSFEAASQIDAQAVFARSRCLPVSASTVSLLLASTSRVVDLVQGRFGSTVSEVAVRETEDALITALSLGVAEQLTPDDGHVSHRNCLRHIRRAQDYIEAHLDEPLSLEVVARATCVSVRTLRYAFKDVLGVPPLRYIKNRRLVAAHQRLRRAADKTRTVTQIAQELGFSHLGYFARDYRRFFGEAPSETLEG